MNRRILILDDHEDLRIALKEYFETKGYDVDCAIEREEAEALLIHVHYDLVLLDLGLTGPHGKEGFEVIRFLRNRAQEPPIILMTADSGRQIEHEGRRLGADGFIRKPIPMASLADLAESLMKKGEGSR